MLACRCGTRGPVYAYSYCQPTAITCRRTCCSRRYSRRRPVSVYTRLDVGPCMRSRLLRQYYNSPCIAQGSTAAADVKSTTWELTQPIGRLLWPCAAPAQAFTYPRYLAQAPRFSISSFATWWSTTVEVCPALCKPPSTIGFRSVIGDVDLAAGFLPGPYLAVPQIRQCPGYLGIRRLV